MQEQAKDRRAEPNRHAVLEDHARGLRRSASGAAVAVAVGALLAGPLAPRGAAAASSTCNVVDTNSNQSYSSVQSAVNAANSGDTLFVKGVCGSAEIYNKTLTLAGQSASGQKMATLDGQQQGTVLQVESGMVTLRSLIVTGGSEPDGAGGISNGGTLVLQSGSITHNYGGASGGGVSNQGTLIINGGSISGNSADQGGGVWNDGTLIINGGSISNNHATTAGGGVYAGYQRSVQINGGGITDNTALDGAGVYNDGTLSLGGGSISGNTADTDGGGVYDDAGTISPAPPTDDTACTSVVCDNTAGSPLVADNIS